VNTKTIIKGERMRGLENREKMVWKDKKAGICTYIEDKAHLQFDSPLSSRSCHPATHEAFAAAPAVVFLCWAKAARLMGPPGRNPVYLPTMIAL
jgi:hypothetical protein